MEQRNFNIELRYDTDTRHLSGEAIVFNSESRDLGGFTETISPEALRGADMSDIYLLFNHNPDAVLGHYSPEKRSFEYEVTKQGVNIDSELPDTTLGRDLSVLIQRGDIDQMSFAFRVAEDGAKWEKRDTGYHRTINNIDKISDFSVVTRAAYTDTKLAVRSLEDFKIQIKDNDVRIDDEAERRQEDLQRQLTILKLRGNSRNKKCFKDNV